MEHPRKGHPPAPISVYIDFTVRLLTLTTLSTELMGKKQQSESARAIAAVENVALLVNCPWLWKNL
ncbi:MAG TPA: hypothetical protein VJI15_02560 [Candidatus Nanoarchaeia archaeon]|nr:hypothetical protein [Candidatus Nanoarchaeia archaeon]